MAKEQHKDLELRVPGSDIEAVAGTESGMPAGREPESRAGGAEAGGDDGAAVESNIAPEREIENLRQELEVARSRLAEQQEVVLRAHAELDNVRKRTLRDVENAHKFALDRFIAELLPVMDSIELGIAASGSAEDVDSLREGMDLTLKKFQDTLGKFGVSTIDPQGEKFNPERHEAVSMQEIEGAEAGTVVTVMQKGYELNGRLVRPAMVVVAR